MAKDDYHYLVFRTLTYLYGVLQCKYSFDEKVFLKTVDRTKDGISEEYLTRVLKFMTDDDSCKPGSRNQKYRRKCIDLHIPMCTFPRKKAIELRYFMVKNANINVYSLQFLV